MTSREDLLDQYIDALNNGDTPEPPDDPELRSMLETIQTIRTGASIEWPDVDLPAEMSRTLQSQLSPTGRSASTNDQPIENIESSSPPSSPTGDDAPDDDTRPRSLGWYSRQFAGIAAAALVVISFGIGLAFILGDWGGEIHSPGAFVEPDEIPGTILYAEYDDEQTIARIDADGTSQQDLATRSVPLFDRAGFSWSPDGEWIAYLDPESRDRDAPAVINLVSADGSESETIDMEPVDGTQRLNAGLVWSDDGSHLALVRQHPDYERHQIVVVHRPSGEVSPVTDGDEPPRSQSSPAWKPGELTIAFSESRGDGAYRIVVTDGVAPAEAVIEDDERAIQPAWSPDGGRLAYVGPSDDGIRGNVHVLNLQSGEAENITGHDERWDYVPTWSSRNQIAFMSDFGNREYDIFVVNPDGTGLRNLTEDIGWSASPPDWSDDGRYLTFTSTSPDQDRWRINVYDIDEDRLYTVHESEEPLFYAQWRPDVADDGATDPEPQEDVDVDTSPFTEDQLELMRQRAEQYQADDESPVALTVNGNPVTEQTIQSQQAEVAYRRSYMQGLIDNSTQGDPAMERYNEAFIELIDEYGPENVGVGAALLDAVIRDYAEENDLNASQDQIDEGIEQQREAHETMEEQDPEAAAALSEAQIEVIGEERYWDEYLPEIITKGLTEQNVNEAAWEAAEIAPEPGPAFQLEREHYLAEFRADLLREAEIEVVEESALGDADLDRAIEYMTEAYPNLQQQRIEWQRELDDPDATPDDG